MGGLCVQKILTLARSKLELKRIMDRFRPINFAHNVLSTLIALASCGALIHLSLASKPAAAGEESKATKNLPRMNCGAKVDCLTPDGRLVAVPRMGEKNSSAAALIMDDDTLSCPLQEGETTFIISFPKTSPLDRFTFVNENAEVKGEMRIAVSNFRLPANSPKWIEVRGKTALLHKRRFNLSMVGVEAHYVKLSFNIEKRGRIASLLQTAQDGIVPIGTTLATQRLEEKLNFNVADL